MDCTESWKKVLWVRELLGKSLSLFVLLKSCRGSGEIVLTM